MPSRIKRLYGEKKSPRRIQQTSLITCENWNAIKKTHSTGLVLFRPKGENCFLSQKLGVICDRISIKKRVKFADGFIFNQVAQSHWVILR